MGNIKQRCRHEGCTKQAVQAGVCIRHGAKTKKRPRCRHEGCIKLARKSGVCQSHGAKLKFCIREGCPNQRKRGGVCIRHGAKKSLATSIGKAETSLQIIKGCKTTAEQTIDALAVKIDAPHYLQANAGHAAAGRKSPSLPPSVMAQSLSDDDNIGAWVYNYVPPEHHHMSAQHFSDLIQIARDDGLVTDGSKGLLIANYINNSKSNYP